MPTPRRSAGNHCWGPATWRPPSHTDPRCGRSKPATSLSRVVLPQPEGPSNPTNSPRCSVRSIWRNVQPPLPPLALPLLAP